MNPRQPLDNTPLSAMLCTGAAMLFLGAIVWFANSDLDYDPDSMYGDADESNAVGQFIGSSIGLAGLLLLVLGWTAAAICRQIADTAALPGRPAPDEEA
jgi:hypothetical protein